jgi:hypothetical protein
MAQKGSSVPAKALDGDLVTVSLRLRSDVAKGPVRLGSLEAKVLREDGTIGTVTVSVGTLEAQ